MIPGNQGVNLGRFLPIFGPFFGKLLTILEGCFSQKKVWHGIRSAGFQPAKLTARKTSTIGLQCPSVLSARF